MRCTLYYYNSGGEREQHGTHASLDEALAEKEELQEELAEYDENFEVVVQFI